MLDSMITPRWFIDAISTEYADCFVEVAGCSIHYQQWPASFSSTNKPLLVLVHGLHANSHWWDFIAPGLQQVFNVIALDLSGMGDSGHRQIYSLDVYAQEVITMVRESDTGAGVYLVGHSFGANIVLHTASQFCNELSAYITVDPSLGTGNVDGNAQTVKKYKSKKELLSSFKLIPEQPCKNTFLLNYIAGYSVTRIGSEWKWKSDRALLSKMKSTQPDIELSICRGVFYGANSQVFPQEAVSWFRANHPNIRLTKFDNAGHHLFLDEPLAFVDSLLKSRL